MTGRGRVGEGEYAVSEGRRRGARRGQGRQGEPVRESGRVAAKDGGREELGRNERKSRLDAKVNTSQTRARPNKHVANLWR